MLKIPDIRRRPPQGVETPAEVCSISINTRLDEDVVQDDESRANDSSVNTITSTTTVNAKKFTKGLLIDERKPVTAETLFEYQWPLNDSKAEYYFLQEQISEFLDIKSFKRKYPHIQRRMVEIEERDFLESHDIVTEIQCDLGLTALNSAEVLDILNNDFSNKYDEYQNVRDQRRYQEKLNKTKAASISHTRVREKSAESLQQMSQSSCAEWNKNFNRERKGKRSSYYDTQTGTIHYPAGKHAVLPPEATKMGYFPVSLIPGQYYDHFQTYTPNEMKYLPLNTVMFGPVYNNENCEEFDDQRSDTNNKNSSSNADSSCSSSNSGDGSCSSSNSGDSSRISSSSEDSKDICNICSKTSYENELGQLEAVLHCAKCNVATVIPDSRWQCSLCSVCHSCNATTPVPNDRKAEWHHEFRETENGYRYYLHSSCRSCYKIYKQGRYCPVCQKCHLQLDPTLLNCRNCKKNFHKKCVNHSLNRVFAFICDSCKGAIKDKAKAKR